MVGGMFVPTATLTQGRGSGYTPVRGKRVAWIRLGRKASEFTR